MLDKDYCHRSCRAETDEATVGFGCALVILETQTSCNLGFVWESFMMAPTDVTVITHCVNLCVYMYVGHKYSEFISEESSKACINSQDGYDTARNGEITIDWPDLP